MGGNSGCPGGIYIYIYIYICIYIYIYIYIYMGLGKEGLWSRAKSISHMHLASSSDAIFASKYNSLLLSTYRTTILIGNIEK